MLRKPFRARLQNVPVVLIAITLIHPVFGEEAGSRLIQSSTTDRVQFADGGLVRVLNSNGTLNVQGWDRPEIQLTVVKSLPYDYKDKQPGDATKRLDAVRVSTTRTSTLEFVISTTKRKSGVSIEYRIYVPRGTQLAVRHRVGYVQVDGLTANIDITAARGDIIYMLSSGASYSIDAKNKLGPVLSDFDGASHLRHIFGESYASDKSPSSRKATLRMGFGGITIKRVPPEAIQVWTDNVTGQTIAP